MSDLKKLDEALATPQWPAERDADWHRAQDDIRYAARAYRNLLANGQRLEWCEEHRSIELNGSTCMAWEQAYSATAEPWEVEIDCRIVSKLLIDPTTEEVTGE